MPTYTAPHVVQIDGALVEPGEKFTTDTGPGELWVKVKSGSADDADDHDKPKHYSQMNLAELTELAAAKGIDLGEAKTKAEIRAVIDAADKPE